MALVAIGHFVEPFVAIGNAGRWRWRTGCISFTSRACVARDGRIAALAGDEIERESGSRAVGDDDLGAFGAKDGDSSETESVRRERRSRTDVGDAELLTRGVVGRGRVYSRLYFDKEITGASPMDAEESTVRELYFSTAELRATSSSPRTFGSDEKNRRFIADDLGRVETVFSPLVFDHSILLPTRAPIALELRWNRLPPAADAGA